MSGFHDSSAAGVDPDLADFVIVGSGAGGGAAARVLAAAGHSVVVLEEGPLVDGRTRGVAMRETLATIARNRGKQAAMGKPALPLLQGRCVGGTTFINSAIVWRLPDKVLARWHKDFGLAAALPETRLDEAYQTIEREMEVNPVADEIAERHNRLMAEGARKAGIEARAIRRYEKGCRGSGRCLHGCPNDAKQSTTINYLRRAVAAGASVWAHAGVERVEFSGTRAVGVRGRVGGDGPQRGMPFRVRARRAVIVAASAVQSPNLLRRSGVRSRHLGEHFMAHPGSTIMGIHDEKVNAWLGAAQGYEAYGLRDTLGVKFEVINVPPEIAASRLPGSGRRFASFLERMDHMAVWACALRAESEGSIRPSWLLGDLVRYSLSPSDMERMRAGLKRLAEMHFLSGAREILTGIHGMPETLTSPDQLDLFDQATLDPGAYGMVATHLFGGCRAAADAAAGVVDGALKVHAAERLYVMDASVFPTNTGVNPQHSIMALTTVAARRLADAPPAAA